MRRLRHYTTTEAEPLPAPGSAEAANREVLEAEALEVGLQVPGGHALEQRLRAIVVAGLFPLLDVLVRGEPRAVRSHRQLDALLTRPSELLALQQLELAHRDEESETPERVAALLPSWWVATELGRDVHQQLAVLRFEALRLPAPAALRVPLETITAADGLQWRFLLLDGWRPAERGARLLVWLRLGSRAARCHACEGPATGLFQDRAWETACDRHRLDPRDWQIAAFELGLQPVPELPLGWTAEKGVRHG